MKQKNRVTLEEIGGSKIKKEKKFVYSEFLKKEILSKFVICALVCIAITLIFTISAVNEVKKLECSEMYCSSEEITISENFMNRAQMLLITGVASMVPYFYLPVLGMITYMITEIISVAHVINVYGYLFGIIRYILPLLLNIISISLVTAMAIYIAKIVTIKFRLSRKSTMNFTTFRLKVYEMMKKQQAYDALNKKYTQKLKKLEGSIRNIKWKGVAITIGITIIIQFVSVVLQRILI